MTTQPSERPTYLLTRWFFLRGLGVVYLVAFVSLWTQIDGLIGSRGILPVGRTLEAAGWQYHGLERLHALPTLLWINSSDDALHVLCGAGVVASLCVIVGFAPAPALGVLWAAYLSLCVVGRDFLNFQWDVLLLEAGFLAVFFAPWHIVPDLSRERPPSRMMFWAIRWLLFRLMFQSGCVKLLSGDPAWRDLTALEYHYETQPLPTWIGWYAHQLPASFQRASTYLMFAIELGVPFLIFLPRRPRLGAFVALVGLQVLIALTGNYCFFNWLALLLCLSLLDDTVLRRIAWQGLREHLDFARAQTELPARLPKECCVAVVTAFSVAFGSAQLAQMFLRRLGVEPGPLQHALRWIAPLRTVNSYGLFAVMTKSRPEIIIEGSDDGRTWRAYEFKYKPGDLTRRPSFVAPHQPRLDWQMWFAALEGRAWNAWFGRFVSRLLDGSPEVLGLLAINPFPDKPPRFVRAVRYEYHFTDPATRRVEGTWWRREPLDLYWPTTSKAGPE